MILRTANCIFATDNLRTLEHYGKEQLITEHNGKTYRISIDKTTMAPYYELFLEWHEGLRRLHTRLYASSSLDKIVAYINDNL